MAGSDFLQEDETSRDESNQNEPVLGKNFQKQEKKRLMITDMVLDNFKSYAGPQHVGPFHKCFTSVVGPNGSGKSNVIDAMLFVFGKRAKQLRLNKVSELIHNSSNHQNLQEARVTVYFQEITDLNDEDFALVPNSKITIARAAYRNNTSKYFINEKPSNFTEVTRLLKSKGVDLDNNRFLILQGEVEQIAMMKPKSQGPHDEGLLEYLEDIVGSNCYIQQIEEVAKTLETLNETRGGMVQRVKLVEKDKDSLEGVKQEAEAYILKEAEKLQWQGKVYELSLHEVKEKVDLLQGKEKELQEKVKEEGEKYAEYKKGLDEMEVRYKALSKEHEVIQKEREICQNEYKEFERKDVKYREDMKHSKAKLKKLEEKMKKDATKVGEMENEVQEATELLPVLEEKQVKAVQVLTNEEKRLEKIQESVKAEVEEYQKTLSQLRIELEPHEKKLNESRARKDIAMTKKNLLDEKHKSAARHYDDAQMALKDKAQSISKSKEDLAAMAVAVEKCQLSATESQNEVESSIKEENLLETTLKVARTTVAEMREALNSEKSQSSMMQALLQAKNSGTIPGIYGRLGDLGAIDKKYDIAISTAGPALDFVVVETASDAQACVELLRKNNLGVGTFLILEKQAGLIPAMKAQLKTPEGVPRLFDLVSTNNECLLPAFYFALRNTVVAKDLDQGARIAYGPDNRFKRVVTLEGALFESSGTMAGGGGKPRGGKMGRAVVSTGVSRESLLEAEQELESLIQKLQILRERKSRAIEGAQKANEKLKALELRIEKVNIEIEALQTQIAELQNRLPSLKEGAQPSEDELASLEELGAIVAAEEQEYLNIQSGCSHLQDEVATLQKKIDNAGSEKLLKQKAEVKRLQQEIDAAGSEINRRKVQFTTNEKAMGKLRKSIDDAKLETEKLSGLLEEQKREWNELEAGAFLVLENDEKVKQRLEAKETELDAIKETYNVQKTRVDELRTGEVDAQFKLDDIGKQRRVYQERMKAFETKLHDLLKEKRRHLTQLECDGMNPEEVQATLLSSSMDDVSKESAQQEVVRLEAELKEMKPNMAAISEYRKKEAEYGERVKDLDAVTQERDETRKQYESLRKKRLDEFMAGFNVITLRLKEMYQMITLGGDAELELVDSLDPFSEGIVFSVRPPKKSWKNISNLSGGEKTLSSLALVFALHHYKPTPLYVMDEIDAALDFKNVSIVAHYIKERTKNAQFVIISLRNNMFELADRLVGIYKTENCTKTTTINPSSFTVASAS